MNSFWKYYGKWSICSFGANAPFSIIFSNTWYLLCFCIFMSIKLCSVLFGYFKGVIMEERLIFLFINHLNICCGYYMRWLFWAPRTRFNWWITKKSQSGPLLLGCSLTNVFSAGLHWKFHVNGIPASWDVMVNIILLSSPSGSSFHEILRDFSVPSWFLSSTLWIWSKIRVTDASIPGFSFCQNSFVH